VRCEDDEVSGDVRREETIESKEPNDVYASGNQAQYERQQPRGEGVLDGRN
jgi:hypothetical protein